LKVQCFQGFLFFETSSKNLSLSSVYYTISIVESKP